MDLTDKGFTMPDNFDAAEYYANAVGIFVNEKLKPQKVVLRVYGVQVEYIRSLPLHSSQKEIKTVSGEYSDFKYRLCLTPELTTKILAMGDKAEVIAPDTLRKEIIVRLSKSIGRYNKGNRITQ